MRGHRRPVPPLRLRSLRPLPPMTPRSRRVRCTPRPACSWGWLRSRRRWATGRDGVLAGSSGSATRKWREGHDQMVAVGLVGWLVVGATLWCVACSSQAVMSSTTTTRKIVPLPTSSTTRTSSRWRSTARQPLSSTVLRTRVRLVRQCSRPAGVWRWLRGCRGVRVCRAGRWWHRRWWPIPW